PVGYFTDFPGIILIRIRENPLSGSQQGVPAPIFPGKGDAAPFQVPEGYFDGFAGGVLNRIRQGQTGEPAFAASAGPEGVEEELARLSPLLSRIDRNIPFRVPEGYFDEMAPILAGLRDKPLYEVPGGYFDGLAEKIAAKITEPAPARVVPFSRKSGWLKYARYSAAAVMTGLILTVGWLRLQRHSSAPNVPAVDINKGLAQITDQELESYLDNHNIPQAEPLLNSTATLDLDDSDVKSLLGDVPDNELKQYMEEHGGAKDIATN
ncbi:MAG TPA: hypothetical protein VNU72_09755, partial [Puia sp.]|nr:hypothetical protein [Puia sp.]